MTHFADKGDVYDNRKGSRCVPVRAAADPARRGPVGREAWSVAWRSWTEISRSIEPRQTIDAIVRLYGTRQPMIW
jgi:hypothetical protein